MQKLGCCENGIRAFLCLLIIGSYYLHILQKTIQFHIYL